MTEHWFTTGKERALWVAFCVAISTRLLILFDGLIQFILRRWLGAT